MFGHTFDFESFLFTCAQYLFGLIFFAALLFRLYICFSNSRRRRLYPPDDIPYPPPPPPPPAPALAPTHNSHLDPWLFQFLPTFIYSSSSATDDSSSPPPECAICLMEFQEGHRGRVLPNCDHVFHSHCIDEWFRSHSNCPLCRKVVDPPRRISPQNENTEAAVGEGQSEGLSNVNIPPPIRFPRKTLQMIELIGITVEIPEEGHHRSQRTSSP